VGAADFARYVAWLPAMNLPRPPTEPRISYSPIDEFDWVQILGGGLISNNFRGFGELTSTS